MVLYDTLLSNNKYEFVFRDSSKSIFEILYVQYILYPTTVPQLVPAGTCTIVTDDEYYFVHTYEYAY